jgi:adenylate cyclase
MANIFVSYADEDSERLAPFIGELEAQGWKVWWDREAHTGPRFDQIIQDEIAGAPCVMVVWADEPAELDPLLDRIHDLIGRHRTPDATAATDHPVVAVLPFRSRSDDQDSVSLGEGIRDALIGELSHSIFRVVSREGSPDTSAPGVEDPQQAARYALSGHVQKSGSRARVSVRLTETIGGEEIWAQRYEHALEDLFDLQDRLVSAIRGELIEAIRRAEVNRLRDVPDDRLDAFALALRATIDLAADRASRDGQLRLLRRAVARDPELGWVHGALAQTLAERVHDQFSRDPDNDRIEAVAEAERAVELAPDEAPVLGLAARVHCHVGDPARALYLAERQRAILGYDTDALFLSLIYTGRSEDVIERAARQPNPDLHTVSLAYMMASRHEEGVEHMRNHLAKAPRDYLGWITLANMLGHLDRVEEGLEAIERVKAIMPTYTVALHEKSIREASPDNEEFIEPLIGGLKKLNID